MGRFVMSRTRELYRQVVPEPVRGRVRQVRDLVSQAREAEDAQSRRDSRDIIQIRLLISYVMSEGANGIDVGANRGTFVAEMFRAAPHGEHIAFEPVPALAEALGRQYPCLSVYQAALADEDSVAEFEVINGNEALSSLNVGRNLNEFSVSAEDRRRIEVPTLRLDSVLSDDDEPTLIKIDVEDTELAVLLGAEQTITRYRPWVVFEHGTNTGRIGKETSKEIWELLCGRAGLSLFDIDGNGPLTPDEFAARASSGDIWNWVAHR
jgi:FkbM family methyltransferase